LEEQAEDFWDTKLEVVLWVQCLAQLWVRSEPTSWKGSTRSIRKRRSMSIRCREANMADSNQVSIPDMLEVTLEVITTDITTIIIISITRDQEVGLADWIVIVIR